MTLDLRTCCRWLHTACLHPRCFVDLANPTPATSRSPKRSLTFLASSVELLPDRANLFPRMQPLLLSPGTHLVAMVRIYSHPASPAALNSIQFEAVVNAAVSATREPNVAALQIDSRYISIFGCGAADGQQDLWQTECLRGTVFRCMNCPFESSRSSR